MLARVVVMFAAPRFVLTGQSQRGLCLPFGLEQLHTAKVSLEAPASWKQTRLPGGAWGSGGVIISPSVNPREGDCGLAILWAPASSFRSNDLPGILVAALDRADASLQGTTHTFSVDGHSLLLCTAAPTKGGEPGAMAVTLYGGTVLQFFLDLGPPLQKLNAETLMIFLRRMRFRNQTRPEEPIRSTGRMGNAGTQSGPPGLRRYETAAYSFEYPAEWTVTSRGREDIGYDFVRLEPPYRGGERIEVRFRPWDRENENVEGTARRIAHSVTIESNGIFQRRYPQKEESPAGTVLRYELFGNSEAPGVEIQSSAIISPDQFAHILYVSNSLQTRSPEARGTVLRSFRFARIVAPVIIGRWAGQGVRYNFGADGKLTSTFANGMQGHGTYHVTDGSVRMNYELVGKYTERTCSYSLFQSSLQLKCGAQTETLRRLP